MPKKYILAEETLGYVTNEDPSNIDFRLLVGGSKNVLIDALKKVRIRPGYTRLGAGNSSLTDTRNGWTWITSYGQKLPQRFYDDELEVYLGTIDGYEINAWTRVSSGWSTTERMRRALWFRATETLDVQLMVIGDDNIYEWGGGVAVVSSITGTTITKKGTTTFAQNHFYATGNKIVVCVRTGTEYTYTGGETTTALTGIADTAGLQENDILIQKVVTVTDKPIANNTNHFIFNFENQIVIGSEDSGVTYISSNSDYTSFTPSSPRTSGQGASVTAEEPTRAIGAAGSTLLIFSGLSSVFKVVFEQVAVGTTVAETLKIKKLDTGVNQGALCQEAMVMIGNSIAFLTNEVALRMIQDPAELSGINPKTLSTPIKPDFDAEDWYDDDNKPDAFIIWYKNMLIITVPQASHMYILNYVEDADGKLFRFWNPPQVLPVGAMSIIDLDDGKGQQLYGHSNGVPETYLLFDGQCDGNYDGIEVEDKLPIDAKAVFAYNNYKKKALLKSFDEYFITGEITPNTTDLLLTLKYDYDGVTQTIEQTIDGSNQAILEGAIGNNSLAQQSLAVNPLGGLLNPPSDARRLRTIIELAKEDFFEIQAIFSTNEVDRYWSILAHGANTTISNRRPTNIHI